MKDVQKENIDLKEVNDMGKKIEDLTKIVKKSVSMNFVEEYLMNDVKFVNETAGIKMIINSGALFSIASKKLMNKYIGVKEENIEYEECVKMFIFGEKICEQE